MLNIDGRVVEAVDILESGGLNLGTGFPVAPPDQFGLDGLEESLDGGIEAPMFVRWQSAVTCAPTAFRQPICTGQG